MTSQTCSEIQLDLDANYYVKHSSLQNNLAAEILSTFLIKPNAHILDVGCGDGRITAELAKRVKRGKVLGIDASSTMIDFAVKNFPLEKFANLRFLQRTAEEVELPSQYDLIVSFSCFHWLKDPELVIRKLTSYLKPGGELLILTYPKESPYYQYLEIALKNYPEYCALSANRTMLTVPEYKELFHSACLNILEFRQSNLEATYNTCEEIQAYIKGWLNSYVPLPEFIHTSFLNDISQAVLKDSMLHQNGKITIPYTALLVRARK
jgi:ubiquinone/menaquinone biosynthesis C-methylase UbiE